MYHRTFRNYGSTVPKVIIVGWKQLKVRLLEEIN